MTSEQVTGSRTPTKIQYMENLVKITTNLKRYVVAMATMMKAMQEKWHP